MTCTHCQALNTRTAIHCVECGGVLEQVLIVPTSPEAAALRDEASAALRHAYRWIAGVTWLYRIGAPAYALVTFFAIIALGHVNVPVQAGVLVVCSTTLLAVLLALGALHVHFKPFAWTVGIALLATAVAVFHLLGPNPLGLAFPAAAGLAVLLWAALAPTFRFSKLIAEHRDLYILHHASLATRRALTKRTPEERHERLIAAMRRATSQAWQLSAAAAVVFIGGSAYGTYTVLDSVRPETLPEALERFETAWNEEGLDAAIALVDERAAPGRREWLTGVAAGHGWRDQLQLPLLEDREVSEEDGFTHVDYDLGGVPLSTEWALDGQRWVLAVMDLPPTPVDPQLELFLDAWRRSDVTEICSHFSADNRKEMRILVDNAASERGWLKYPTVLDTRRKDNNPEETIVTLVLEEGEVKVRWYVRPDGTWGLGYLRFPKR